MHYKPGQLCVYLSSDTATWDHAKAICEKKGARVLILDTLEVIRWFSTQMSLKMGKPKADNTPKSLNKQFEDNARKP